LIAVIFMLGSGRTQRREVTAMINLLIIMGAFAVALRMVWPLARIVVSMLTKLAGFAFVMALGIILAIAVLSHGAVI